MSKRPASTRVKTASSKKGIYYTSLCFTTCAEFCCSIKVYTSQLESLQISDDEDVPVAPPPIALPAQAPRNATTAPVQPPHAVLPARAPRNTATVPVNSVASKSSSSTINEPRRRGPAPFTLDQKSIQRKLKNAQRKELRQRLARDNPEAAKQQMREAGQLRAPLVAEVLQDVFNELATYELAIAHALSTPYPSDLMFIQAVVNVNPTQWDASSFLQDRTIILSKKGDPPPVSAVHNYIRRIAVPNATKALKNFLVAYPANAASTTLQLILQGENLERIKDMFVDSLRAYGLEDAAIAFMDLVINHPATKILHRKHVGLRNAPQKLAYTGITEAVACRDRAEHDLRNGVAVAVINFLTSNEELAVETYHIPGLNTPTFGPYDLRTNPVASQEERIIRALLGASAMNSAEGGVLPIFLPTSEEVLLRQRALPAETHDPLPLGEDQDTLLSDRIRMFIADEIKTFRPLDIHPISRRAIDGVHSKLPDVIWKSNGRVVKMEVTSDITHESFLGKCGGYWDDTTGCGPREEHHLRRLSCPEILPLGSISQEILVKHLGPFVDFWRVDLRHGEYRLHVLYMSRLIHIIDSLVVVTHSNALGAIFRSFDLVNDWSRLSPPTAQSVLDGHTPPNILDELPRDSAHREYSAEAFKEALGTIKIIRTSPDPIKISLHVVQDDIAQLKYDPILSRLKWKVSYLVRLNSDTVVQAAAHKLKHDDVINWSEAEAVRRWLEEVKGAAERQLDETGVTCALEAAKSNLRRQELAVTFLRTLVRAPPKSYTYTVRKERLKAVPSGDARNAQLAEILNRARQLDSFDLPPDPDHLAPFCHPILSDTFPSWFLSLKDGVEIVASANSHGRSNKGCATADATHAAIAQWNKDNVDVVAIAQKNMRVAIRDGESLGMTAEVIIKELQWSWQTAICDRCDSFCIANHNAAYHRCPDTVDDSEDRTLSERNFPIIDHILYAHDILHKPRRREQLGNMSDLLSELHLFAVPSREGNAALVKALRPLDVTAVRFILQDPMAALQEVFVSEARINDLEFLVTLAFDVVLAQHSTCSQALQPVSPNHHRAWKVEVSDMLADWYNGKAEDLHIVRCTGNPNEPPTGPPEGSWFITTKVKTKIARNGGGQTVDQTCCMCSDSKACRFRKFNRALVRIAVHHQSAGHKTQQGQESRAKTGEVPSNSEYEGGELEVDGGGREFEVGCKVF
ncbi:hypothetical protein DFH09DRAFT_1080639 [Mycena vulgaris]|nr:hypothetical protein DFH09DRAFT_1080639 [Mycena vulgaris]